MNNKKKEHQSDALSLVQYVAAAAQVQHHNFKEFEEKMTQR